MIRINTLHSKMAQHFIQKISILLVLLTALLIPSFYGAQVNASPNTEPSKTINETGSIEQVSNMSGCNGLFCKKGYFDWRGGFSSKNTDFVQSTDRGWVCVASDLDSYNLTTGTSYTWKIQEYTSAGWWNVRESSRFLANGNDDVQCFDREIEPRRFYRAKFGLKLPGGFVHGHYTIRGFYSLEGPIN